MGEGFPYFECKIELKIKYNYFCLMKYNPIIYLFAGDRGHKMNTENSVSSDLFEWIKLSMNSL